MIKKIISALILPAFLSIFVIAQSDDDYKKVEFFAGYSNGQGSDGKTYNGFNISSVYNVSRYFGIKADFSGGYGNSRESFQISTGGVGQTFTFDSKRSIYNVLGGIQIKDNGSKARFKPFVHVLAGLGHRRFETKNSACTPGPVTCANSSFSETGLAAAFGGGLDIRINRKLSFRAFQIDYNPMIFNGRTDNNARFSTGFVF